MAQLVTFALEYCIDLIQDYNFNRTSSIQKFISKFCSLFDFRMVREQIFLMFEHGFIGQEDICNSTRCEPYFGTDFEGT